MGQARSHPYLGRHGLGGAVVSPIDGSVANDGARLGRWSPMTMGGSGARPDTSKVSLGTGRNGLLMTPTRATTTAIPARFTSESTSLTTTLILNWKDGRRQTLGTGSAARALPISGADSTSASKDQTHRATSPGISGVQGCRSAFTSERNSEGNGCIFHLSLKPSTPYS